MNISVVYTKRIGGGSSKKVSENEKFLKKIRNV